MVFWGPEKFAFFPARERLPEPEPRGGWGGAEDSYDSEFLKSPSSRSTRPEARGLGGFGLGVVLWFLTS